MRRNDDLDALQAVRPGDLFEQRLELDLLERLAADLGGERELAEDGAAARQLLLGQRKVVAGERGDVALVGEFVDDHGEGGERRAEFVRSGGREAVELRQVLGAGQDQVGGGERVAELARLLGDLAAVDGDEHRADDDGDQRARSSRSAAD